MCSASRVLLPVLLLAPIKVLAQAQASPGPAQLCHAAIAATERVTRIPDAFLNAIGRVESGRPQGGTPDPWPWTVNAAGAGHFYASKGEAISAVQHFLAQGVRSLDVGCLQVNLFYHPDAFANLDQAFDPLANAAYAGKLLMTLFQQTGSWPRAAAAYHSMTPALGEAYQRKVLEAWSLPDRPQAQGTRETAPAEKTASPPIPPVPSVTTVAAISAGTTPPLTGFTRRFSPPLRGLGTGRSLADYRATAIRLAGRAPIRTAVSQE